MATITAPQSRPQPKRLPPLETGDRLDQPKFHARYEAMPPHVRAELIGGIVYMPSPLKADHGFTHADVMFWLGSYKSETPGIEALDNTTSILGKDSEPQPDDSLIILGGQTSENEEGYLTGAPELVVEVASSSESYDLHIKKADYEKYGVREYIVVMVRESRVVWFVREKDRFIDLPPDKDGILRSRHFPGLWLDAGALLGRNTLRVTEVLESGLKTPEHSAFIARLASR
jgi:Uma2 family endonuclease